MATTPNMSVTLLESSQSQKEITVNEALYRFDALVSFSFNLGSGALQRSTLRRVVNREAHVEVARQLMRWVFASGRKLKGLEKRRAAEAALYIG